jgi:hypothetical protein
LIHFSALSIPSLATAEPESIVPSERLLQFRHGLVGEDED